MMKKSTRNQLLLITAGVLVGVLIFLAPDRLSNDSAEDDDHHTSEPHNHEHEHQAESNASTEQLSIDSLDQLFLSSKMEQLKLAIDDKDKLEVYDSLILFSKRRNYPPLVASYSEQKAQLINTEEEWMTAGDNYFKAFRLSKNTDKTMISKAIESYEKVSEINDNNLSAKTAIGVAYVEGAAAMGVMPMKGIGLLKEVLEEDPENIDALTNLGYFSIQSGQYEKAIERFETILTIDSTNAEAYIYLTDIYLSQDNQEKGIQTLTKYKTLVNDPLVSQQVDEYIEEIRNK